MKGAPEVILRRCKNIYDNGSIRRISKADRITITQQVNSMTTKALRVLMLAYKDLAPNNQNFTDEDVEQELTYIGIVGMIDPPREEVKSSISKCQQAGIRVVMNTGDHLNTAMAVSKEIGLINEESKVITGNELEQMDDTELDSLIDDVSVVARVSPEHKVRILTSLKRRGHIVAMTGDGVNDAPALKSADVGISMGLNGTEVAKEASHMVLADDNFASIVNAVEEGRSIFDNIRKFIRYLISANLDELMVVGLALILGWPIPFLPIQILWINLVTDGPPALALGIDPKEKDIMQKPPRNPKENVLRSLLLYSFIAGFLAFLATIYVFINQFFVIGASINRARTMAFTTTMIFEMILVFSIREENHSMFSSHSFENKYLLLAVASSFVLQLAVVYVPIMQVIFETEALLLFDWIFMLGLCLILVTILDIIKTIYYKRKIPSENSQLSNNI